MLGERGFWLPHATSSAPGATARTVWRAASMMGRTAEGTSASQSGTEDLEARAFTQPRLALGGAPGLDARSCAEDSERGYAESVSDSPLTWSDERWRREARAETLHTLGRWLLRAVLFGVRCLLP